MIFFNANGFRCICMRANDICADLVLITSTRSRSTLGYDSAALIREGSFPLREYVKCEDIYLSNTSTILKHTKVNIHIIMQNSSRPPYAICLFSSD